MASRIALVSFSLILLAKTRTRQGWMLLPEALRLAGRSNFSTVARSTGVGRKARTDLRLGMASSRAGAASDVSCIGQTQCFQAFRDFAEEQPLDIFIGEQRLRAPLDRNLPEMHDIAAVRDRERMRGLLLHHDHR